MKTAYTSGSQKTETVTFFKGARERFEFADMVVLKQHDLKRTVQISRAANTYLVIPDASLATPPTPPPATDPQQKPGIVTMTTTITDTGERKSMFGMEARHVKTVIDRTATPVACDPSKQHIESDGWYVDLPATIQSPPDPAAQLPPATCVDEIKATQNGDPKALGFPIGYTTTITGEDGKPNAVVMEISELEITNLDAALFDIPAGLTEAGNLGALTKAVSDANEVKLAEQLTTPAAPVQKTPGVALVGVLEVANKTTQQVETRALRDRLVSQLVDQKITASPLAGSQPDVIQQAMAHGYDYVLVAEVTDLKVSKAGGLGGALKAASKLSGGDTGQQPTEATMSIKLVQPDGKSRLATNVKGKTGGGLDLKTGLGVAKFAGGMYMNMMTGKMMMNMMNQGMTGNLQGMGMLGNTSLATIQSRGLGESPLSGMGVMRMGIDPTAGSASFLFQQAMASQSPISAIGGVAGAAAGQSAPSFDASIGDALQQAAKAVADEFKKAETKKK
jgi:hypothetical protein